MKEGAVHLLSEDFVSVEVLKELMKGERQEMHLGLKKRIFLFFLLLIKEEISFFHERKCH